jgi:hypothetical protein
LDVTLANEASKRFKNRKKVKILQGDSGQVLHTIIPQLNGPAVFWLDGHYSAGVTAKGEKECPILEELSAIFISGFHHVLLIDDAHCFVGENDYPTLQELSDFILIQHPEAKIEVKDNIIRVIY